MRKHLSSGARLIFDVLNPSVRRLALADGVRRRRDALSFADPGRGVVHVDVAETCDAAARVTHGTWYFSTDSEADFVVAPLEIRCIFPQELPLLLSLGGLRSLNDSAIGPVRLSPQIRRSRSASANRTEPGARQDDCRDPNVRKCLRM